MYQNYYLIIIYIVHILAYLQIFVFHTLLSVCGGIVILLYGGVTEMNNERNLIFLAIRY